MSNLPSIGRGDKPCRTPTDTDAQALDRARHCRGRENIARVYSAFLDRGIPEEDILPGENILTFRAWKALGRFVSKGQHGVRLLTYVERDKKVERDGKETTERVTFPKSTHVFHISQTEAMAQAVTA